MSKTIVQEYGPIYGEPVNGTVQGRPNGSVFKPLSNIVSISLIEDNRYVKTITSGGIKWFRLCTSSGTSIYTGECNMVAISQDLASYIQMQFYSDSDLTDLLTSRDFNAGIFNVLEVACPNVDDTGLTAGDTIYLRCQLMNNATAVATSDVIELEYVIP